MKRYVVLLGAEPDAGPPAAPEGQQEAVEAHAAFQHHVAGHGRLLSSAALGGVDTATTVHPGPEGSRTVSDGPLREVSEQLVGYYDVELADLDAAITAARLLPAACAVEIRPVVGLSGRGVA